MVSRFLIAALLFAAPAAAQSLDEAVGKALFERHWVSAPSSTRADSGLGPLYDARSCDACHGGGHAGVVSESSLGAGLVLRLGNKDGRADPVYGRQLQLSAVPGVAPEALARLAWYIPGDFRGTIVALTLNYGPLSANMSLRRAPDLFGIGLLAAIPDRAILAQAQREAHLGIHGRPAWVGSAIGRWGWKATTANLTGQVDLALQRDIGLSTASHPGPWGECTEAEQDCRNAARDGRRIEVPDALRDAIVAYLTSLPAPAPDFASPGAAVFEATGCATCHRSLATADGRSTGAMTDLLLHDMGHGLDDRIKEGAARTSEWRTAPLWHVADELAAGGLLHDGRARSIDEAVRWHDGQAAWSRARFAELSPSDRKALEDFLLGR